MTYDWTEYTILIVEDDIINFKFLDMVLKKRTGVQITWVQDGCDAYKKIGSLRNIDLVLLDLHLPIIDGIDILISAKKMRPHLPIIMQTANVWGDTPQRCQEAGCDGFFSKPIDIDKFLKFIDEKIKVYSKYKLDTQSI